MHYRTSFLNVLPSSPPLYPDSSLTSAGHKATFYIFHSLPEYLVALYIQTSNLRAIFNTGPFGDWRASDRRGGIPRLRKDGVYVDDVGIAPQGERPFKPPLWWVKLRGQKSDDADDAKSGEELTRREGVEQNA